jgi:hypothetical protein
MNAYRPYLTVLGMGNMLNNCQIKIRAWAMWQRSQGTVSEINVVFDISFKVFLGLHRVDGD